MPYQIIRADIVDLPFKVDVIVNTAKEKPVHGDGVDRAIYSKAGNELTEKRNEIGDIPEGNAVLTEAYRLNADYLIHVVAPVWKEKNKEESIEILRQCYKNVFEIGKHYSSIACPLIGSGNLKFPKNIALRIAIDSIIDFCLDNDTEVFLVLFDKESCEYGERLCGKFVQYVADADIEHKMVKEYTQEDGSVRSLEEVGNSIYNSRILRDKRKDTINIILRNPLYSSFGDVLNELMRELRSIDNPRTTQAYLDKHGYCSSQYLGQIRKNKKVPGKVIALSIAIGLRLNLAQAQKLIYYAGHRLDKNNEWDNIVMKAISDKVFDIAQINQRLADAKLSDFLGSERKNPEIL